MVNCANTAIVYSIKPSLEDIHRLRFSTKIGAPSGGTSQVCHISTLTTGIQPTVQSMSLWNDADRPQRLGDPCFTNAATRKVASDIEVFLS